jgi:putative DNA primase/helicase
MTRERVALKPKSSPKSLTLDDLVERPCWVAWREEMRPTKDGAEKPTKIPYDPNCNQQARIPTDPSTWGTRKQAEQRWRKLDDGRPGGVGIVLGELDDGTLLMGIDLDSCIETETNTLTPLAEEVLDRFDTYAEVSPSRSGVKLCFQIAPEDVEEVGQLLSGKTRKTFSAGVHREMAIDRARFYAVTDECLDGVPPTLRTVEVSTVRWFIEELGPHYLKSHKPASNHGTRTRETRIRDESGSGYGFRFMRERKAAGDDYEAAREDILANQAEAGEWARRVDERQLQRAWNAVQEVLLPHDDPLICAQRFVEIQFARDGGCGLVYYRGDFYEWTGTHYEICDDAHLRSRLYGFLAEAKTTRKDEIVPFKPNQHKVNEIIDALKAGVEESSRPDAPFWLGDDNHPDADNLLPCRNGLLDLTTRKLLPHHPKFFNVICLPFDYDPKAREPKIWNNFLRQIWPGDDDGKQARLTLHEILGLLLTPDTGFQKIFLLVGPKRSGKGTIGRVLRGLLGHDNVVSPTLAGLSGDFGLQPLINKRAAIVSDARLGPRTNSSVVVERLLSISGEDAQTVNRKFKLHWTGRLGTRFLIMTNELPRMTDASGAIASRFVLLTLQRSFYDREDPELTDKLLGELPGILNAALRGLDRLRKRGRFVMPKSSVQALQTLEDLTSPVGAFLRDWCSVGADQRVTVKELYDAWTYWCQQQGMPSGSASVFGRNLLAAHTHVQVKGRAPGRFYEGVALSAEGADEYAEAYDRAQKPSRSSR